MYKLSHDDHLLNLQICDRAQMPRESPQKIVVRFNNYSAIYI
ncbi:hypothetical protein [Nostoc sp. WHI]|nr:hypothetical protein [Nostoc sp. WHI]